MPTPFDLLILKTLWRLPTRSITQSAIADLSNVSPATVQRALDRLEANYLIQRKQRGRGRRTTIQFTDKTPLHI